MKHISFAELPNVGDSPAQFETGLLISTDPTE